MAEFRVKWEYNFAGKSDDPEDFYYCVETLVEAVMILDVLHKYDKKLEFNDAVGHVQFKHPTLGWTNMETDDDEGLSGEAYLSQSG